ncbi:MAG TPA: TetR/AcrR family transcriptional regulator [Solirubrobacteraceae bacterium]|nr:TetR/AcrR family transcriptional regulator [Solirubrobacteraceae bacterium]
MSSPARTRPADAAILDATERLLRERPFADLSVGDIIDAAGVSRTSFYAHFPTRSAMLAACLRRVVDELVHAVEPFLSEAVDDPEAAIRTSLERWVGLATAHGPLLRTASEEWPHDPELRALWFDVMGTFSRPVARVIEAARAAGSAPPGADPEALAACLMWGCERVLHVALVGGALGLEDPAAIVAPLAQMMAAGVFAQPRPGADIEPPPGGFAAPRPRA